MSLKNYTVVPVETDERLKIEQLCQEMDGRSHAACHVCGDVSSYGTWACWVCKRDCRHDGIVLHGYIYRRDGSLMAWSRCFTCGRMVKGLPRGSRILDICLRDNRGDGWGDPCEHCGAEDTQRHHWAPQAIFDDPEEWPTAWLCRDCHRHWHDMMRRAGGVSIRREQAS